MLLDLVDPPESSAALADGYRVEVRVVTWRGEDVLLVPEAALVRDGERWAVFRASGGVVEEVTIEIGHRDGRSAEVLLGLGLGDAVVLYPSDRMKHGARVRDRGDSGGAERARRNRGSRDASRDAETVRLAISEVASRRAAPDVRVLVRLPRVPAHAEAGVPARRGRVPWQTWRAPRTRRRWT